MNRISDTEKERCKKAILELEQAKIKPYLDKIANLEKENAEAKEIIRQVIIVSNLKTGKEPMIPTSLFVRAEIFLGGK